MFSGHFIHNLDTKNRLTIPAKFLKFFPEHPNRNVILMRGLGLNAAGKCIAIYPEKNWEPIQERISRLDPFNEEDSYFLRLFSHGITDDKIDGQGRLIMNQYLMNHAEIEKEVLVLGAYNKIEIWNPAIYERYEASKNESFDQIAARVMRRDVPKP